MYLVYLSEREGPGGNSVVCYDTRSQCVFIACIDGRFLFSRFLHGLSESCEQFFRKLLTIFFMLSIDKARIFSHIIEQHVDDAAFLWLMRSQAMTQAHQTPGSIGKIEQRINNHIKGLFNQASGAWEYSHEAAECQEGGEMFVLAMLALSSGDSSKINTLLELTSGSEEAFKGFISALGWLPASVVNPLLKLWVNSKEPLYQYACIAACSVRRVDPKVHLTLLLSNVENIKNIPLYCRMLRLVGELKRHDLNHLLAKMLDHENGSVSFWAHWSTLMLGDRSALKGFERFVLESGPHQLCAISVAVRCHDHTHAWYLIRSLVKSSTQTAQTIAALSALGDPKGVLWLLDRMKEPQYAKLAGEAFSQITGVDLELQGLTESNSAGFDDGEEEGDIPILLGCESLPMPIAEKVREYWSQVGHHFNSGRRYFWGGPLELNTLEKALRFGRQRQRLSAAIELALMNREKVYQNAKALLAC